MGHLLLDRAHRKRREPPRPPEPESIYVPAAAIWRWVLEDMVRCGHDPVFAAEVVADLAQDIDHLAPDEVEELVAEALAEALAEVAA